MNTKPDLAFSSGTIDRASMLRKDMALIDRLALKSNVLNIVIWQGKVLLETKDSIIKLSNLPSNHKLINESERLAFLGFTKKKSPVFLHALKYYPKKSDDDNNEKVKFIDNTEDTHPYLTDESRFIDLRKVINILNEEDSNLCGTAKSLYEWLDGNRYCSRCGNENSIIESGWELLCSKCESKTFPRTDPVVIMLIERAGSVLLGRSSLWPQGMYSCLAGFLEPGESIEDAVSRETFEEVGIRVKSIRYITNQSWPFPHSLMIGCFATATNSNLTIDYNEIEDARWFKKEELVSLRKTETSIKVARKGTIANYLIDKWINERV